MKHPKLFMHFLNQNKPVLQSFSLPVRDKIEKIVLKMIQEWFDETCIEYDPEEPFFPPILHIVVSNIDTDTLLVQFSGSIFTESDYSFNVCEGQETINLLEVA